ncbi:SDR family NAD(P)-dependent oxidoreductase [Geodermatophilus sp. Leaf369]|uniref:SDR family NAD(P)-dependent oxidoreductase n=1 Tax=Geodermatophilus sp. Leaf369 TaxID=1736354 RepID=UPI0019102B91|nr:SDR family NAD(P)-dependent oxidoreductase [Geodermatophilus sp. Leaf369]
MGARRRGLPRLRRLPAQDRPGDPGRARGAPGLSGDGRVVVVTGASDGIGAAAARRLHRDGAHVVVVGRSPEKTAAVAAELPGSEPLTADFARLDDVRALAAAIAARHPRVDVLCNNAGASFGRRRLTVDGHETTFQVDHLAGYLLTRLLEPQLRAARGRVVHTASFMHRFGWVPRGRLARAFESRPPYVANRAYAKAKFANVLTTRELARRWGPDVSSTCYDPGAVASSFGVASGGVVGLAFRTPLTAFFRTPAHGADTMVWLATAPEGWRNGGYHVDRSPGLTLLAAKDDRRARELWDLSADLVGLAP